MHKLSGIPSLMLITGKPSSPSCLSKFLPSYHPWSAHPPLTRMWLSWLHTQASINQCNACIWTGPCQMQPTFFCAPGWYYEELSDLIHIPRIAMYWSHFCFPSSLDLTWVMLDWPPWNQTFTRKSYRFGFTLIIRSWQNTFPPPHIYNPSPPWLSRLPQVFWPLMWRSHLRRPS